MEFDKNVDLLNFLIKWDIIKPDWYFTQYDLGRFVSPFYLFNKAAEFCDACGDIISWNIIGPTK